MFGSWVSADVSNCRVSTYNIALKQLLGWGGGKSMKTLSEVYLYKKIAQKNYYLADP